MKRKAGELQQTGRLVRAIARSVQREAGEMQRAAAGTTVGQLLEFLWDKPVTWPVHIMAARAGLRPMAYMRATYAGGPAVRLEGALEAPKPKRRAKRVRR